ncbi:hypothetical protein BJX99DRAFT_260903 [Aspergillus californicus]
MSMERQSSAPLDCVNLNLVNSPAYKYGMLELQDHEISHCSTDEMSPGSFPVWPQKTRHLWSNFFKICYNQNPTLDDDDCNFILENCLALVELGEIMSVSDLVSQAVSTTLLSFGQQLYRLIAQDPCFWVKLAVRIRSTSMFKEAMVHLVGKWGLLDDTDRESLPKDIRSLCEIKVDELNLIKKTIELRVVNHIPRPRSTIVSNRETHSTFAWMALTFYQQWLCQSFVENRNYHAPDGGAAFYRAIAAGGDAYLDRLDRDIAHLTFADSQTENSRGFKELEKDLNELKKGIKDFVSDLLVNEAKYDAEILGQLPYLTCCQVAEDEMPQYIETNVIGYQTPHGTEEMTSDRNDPIMDLQPNFLPSQPLMTDPQQPINMMGFSNTTNHFLRSPETDNSEFDAFSAFTHQNPLRWDDSMNFPNTTFEPRMPSFSDMGNCMYQMSHDQGTNMGNMDVYGGTPFSDSDGYVQNDENMAFN